jgi:sugar lactone lactonase YvrE
LKPRKVSEIGMLTSILLPLVLVASLPLSSEVVTTEQATIVIGSSNIVYPAGGLAFDPKGSLWVADLQNSRVLGFSAPFTNNMNASIVLGQTDFHEWVSGWYANEMTFPSSVTFDRSGNLWVADTQNDRVTEFTPPFHNGMNASLVIGQKAKAIPTPPPDWSSTVVATSQNGLAAPVGIVFDKYGDLWVADSWNGRVLEFQPPFSNNMNASLVIGERDFTTSCNQNTRPVCGDSRTLNYPVAIAFDAIGNLWVTDTLKLGTYAAPHYQGRLLEFTSPFSDGMEAALVIDVPAGSSSLAFDSGGNLWLGCAACTSNGNGYVSEYDSPFSNSMKPSHIVGGNNLFATSQTVTNPTGLTFDSAGNLWVVDSNRVLGFNTRVHSVLGRTGRVYFENDVGLLVPLSAFTATMGLNSYPEGLFNFTIQGLPAGGSVKLTITFPDTLLSGVGWVNVITGNPLGSGAVEWSQLPASQVQVDGNNMTLTLTNASEEGVISMVGGPAVPPITSRTVTSPISRISSTSPFQPPTGPPTDLISLPLAIVIVTIAFVLYRKRSTKRRRD